jgi:hypothetical protein
LKARENLTYITKTKNKKQGKILIHKNNLSPKTVNLKNWLLKETKRDKPELEFHKLGRLHNIGLHKDASHRSTVSAHTN